MGASPSRQPSPTSDVLRGTATSLTLFSATNTMIVSTTSQRTGSALMVLSSTPSAEREPCDHYFNVDCGDRLELQPPKGPSDLCPRLNGFYSHPDPGVCHIFYACVDGTAEEYTCSSGLWFDEYSGVCNWPEVTDRKDCKADAYETNNGFTCPEKAPTDEFGQFGPHPKYSDSDDCAKFYICLNGISPREQGCELGLVYNEVSKQCDAPENVPECKDYYAFLEDGEQSKKRRK